MARLSARRVSSWRTPQQRRSLATTRDKGTDGDDDAYYNKCIQTKGVRQYFDCICGRNSSDFRLSLCSLTCPRSKNSRLACGLDSGNKQNGISRGWIWHNAFQHKSFNSSWQ
eukprot:1459763-Amphidinium_carterae.1